LKKIIVLPSIIALLAWGACSMAQESTAPERKVTSILISGLKAVSEQLVRAQLEVQVGQTYNPGAVARDLRRLYSLGHFDTIKVEAAPEAEGIALTYVVQEKRIIDAIRIMGNNKIGHSKIRAVLSWKEGDSFSPDAYDEERKAILKLYEEKAFANSAVDINVEEVGPSRVRVTYVIDEGRKARIRSIKFEGNDVLTSRDLRKMMKTKRVRWFLGGKYKEEKFEADLKAIIEKCGNIGRLEAAILATNITYSQNGRKMDVLISLKEGPEYKVEAVEAAQNQVFDDDEIIDVIKVHSDDVHNKGQVAKDADLIAKGYRDSGYVNAEVTPQVTLDREKKTTHIVHSVKEGDLKYVKQINVAGNSITKDEVIRRDVMIEPGDRFDGSAVKLSQQRLENTRYFENIRLTVHDLDDDDLYTNLMVDVDEGKTGNFNFGAGYSSEEKIAGFTELRLNNFDITNWPSLSGGGQVFSARLHLGEIRSQYYLSFTEPAIFGYPLALGVDAFDESYKYTHSGNYREDTIGGQLRLKKALSPFVALSTGVRLADVSYGDLADANKYTDEWRRELSSNTTISNSWAIERNTLDYNYDPSSGSKHEVVATVAGFGGDNEFVKLEHDSTWFVPLDSEKKWVLSLRTREGWATPYGSSDRVPLADRFFVGGTTTVRGYETRDIGPKSPRYRWPWSGSGSKNDLMATGGDLRLVNNLEMKYKVVSMLRLYAFVDSGGVWDDSTNLDLGAIKYSGGIGLGVDVPRIGPIRVDYGIPINPNSDQGSGKLHLMTGFRF